MSHDSRQEQSFLGKVYDDKRRLNKDSRRNPICKFGNNQHLLIAWRSHEQWVRLSLVF